MAGQLPDWLSPTWRVPRCWPDEIVAILACGSSLIQEDIDYVRDRCRVIAINRSYIMAPTADWLYACDPGRFWVWCGGPQRLYADEPDAWDFTGTKITVWSPSLAPPHLTHMQALLTERPEVKVLQHRGHGDEHHNGTSDDPGIVKGNNSLFQVLSVIAFTGVKRVVLLGADMKGGHFHKPWPMGEPNYIRSVAPRFKSLVETFQRRKIEVINCSRGGSAIDAFPCRELEEVLP